MHIGLICFISRFTPDITPLTRCFTAIEICRRSSIFRRAPSTMRLPLRGSLMPLALTTKCAYRRRRHTPRAQALVTIADLSLRRARDGHNSSIAWQVSRCTTPSRSRRRAAQMLTPHHCTQCDNTRYIEFHMNITAIIIISWSPAFGLRCRFQNLISTMLLGIITCRHN